MEENLKANEKFKRAFNLGYELAKELDLKTPLFTKEGSDITIKSPMQAGIFQYVQERNPNIHKSLSKSNTTSKSSVIKRTFKKNKGKGLTP